MGLILRLFGSTVFKYSIVAIVATLFGWFGISWIKTTLHKATQYDVVVLERDALITELDSLRQEHAKELISLEEARNEIIEGHKEFENRAYRQIDRLQRDLKNDKEASDWGNVDLPDAIKRMREQKTAEG
jgi:hypothetical protein